MRTWLRMRGTRGVDRTQVFTSIYAQHAWAGESVSGQGSDLEQTEVLRQQLPLLLQQFGIRRLLDAPCGDFNWMQHVSLDTQEYIGVDIVAELIASNQQKYGHAARQFVQRDLVTDALPAADLILCRDCLVHLCFRDIHALLQNFRQSGARYLLTTTFPQQPKNWDIVTGEWRGLNLQRPPFRWPKPLYLLNEQCLERADKCLGLWNIADLPI